MNIRKCYLVFYLIYRDLFYYQRSFLLSKELRNNSDHLSCLIFLFYFYQFLQYKSHICSVFFQKFVQTHLSFFIAKRSQKIRFILNLLNKMSIKILFSIFYFTYFIIFNFLFNFKSNNFSLFLTYHYSSPFPCCISVT